MKKEWHFWAIDLFAFTSQFALGIISLVYGLLSTNEIFIPIGIAISCGGLNSLSLITSYLRGKKNGKNVQSDMFDERSNLISNKASSVSFKLTIVVIQGALLISILPYNLPYYVFPFCITAIMLVSIISYFIARAYYSDKY